MSSKNQRRLPEAEPKLISGDVPFSYAEAYKALRTNFSFLASNGKARKVIVTSALPNEGKSMVAINLAISLSQMGSKVLLIDADLRNPAVRRYLRLDIDPQKGLSTLLNGEVKVGACLVKAECGVDVIASGRIPPNPTELIRSESMASLLTGAEKLYDYIICDTPPVGVITDAAALSPLCDGVVFVIRQKYSSKNQVRGAMKKLQTVNAKILGVVLSQYEIPKSLGKDYNYYHGYGYGRN